MENLAQFEENWPMILRTYTAALLTKKSDRLIALAGIIGEILDLSLKGQYDYLAGMWESDLPHSLFWYVVDGKPSFRPADYRAPSRSWASVEGDILIMGRLDEATAGDLTTIVGVEIYCGDRIGAQSVYGGHMLIREPFGKVSGKNTA